MQWRNIKEGMNIGGGKMRMIDGRRGRGKVKQNDGEGKERGRGVKG